MDMSNPDIVRGRLPDAANQGSASPQRSHRQVLEAILTALRWERHCPGTFNHERCEEWIVEALKGTK